MKVVIVVMVLFRLSGCWTRAHGLESRPLVFVLSQLHWRRYACPGRLASNYFCSVHHISVPPTGPLRISSDAPMIAARSRMPVNP